MPEITDIVVEGLSPVLVLIIQVLGVLITGYAIKGAKMLVKKVGLDVDSAEFKKITELVDSAVIKTNQKVVSKLKAASERGKLTEEQEEQVFNMSKDALLSILDSKQVQKIIAKYGDLDEGIETLIENSVSYNKSITGTAVSTAIDNTDTIAEKITEVLTNIFGDDSDDEHFDYTSVPAEMVEELAKQIDKEVMEYVNIPDAPTPTAQTEEDTTVTTATTEEAAEWKKTDEEIIIGDGPKINAPWFETEQTSETTETVVGDEEK